MRNYFKRLGLRLSVVPIMVAVMFLWAVGVLAFLPLFFLVGGNLPMWAFQMSGKLIDVAARFITNDGRSLQNGRYIC